MESKWQERTLGELTDNYDAVRVPVRKTDRRPGPYPYYGASGIVDHIDGYLFDGEYLLVAEDGENLRTRKTPIAFMARGKFWVNNHAHIVRGNEHADTRFLMYSLREIDIRGYLTGSTMPKLTQGNLSRISLLIPSLDEQRAIANILSTLDDKIELNRRMSATLEAMARALFKSWFVDFDPVRAKAEGRDPGLPPDLADLFPDRFVDSELGEIPEGWEVGTLADYSTFNPEAWTTNTQPIEIRYVDLSNTKWGRIESIAAYQYSDAPTRARRVLSPGDTIVGTVRPGNGSYALIAEEGLTGSTGFAVLRPTKPEYIELVYLAATSPSSIEALAQLATGGAYPAVSAADVAATPIARASEEIVGSFSCAVRALFARLAFSDAESRTLAALRDTLLPKLVSGKLPISNAERFIGKID